MALLQGRSKAWPDFRYVELFLFSAITVPFYRYRLVQSLNNFTGPLVVPLPTCPITEPLWQPIFQYSGSNQPQGLLLGVPDVPNAAIDEIHDYNITCLGEFHQSNGSLVLSSTGSSEGLSGRCLYRNPLQLSQACGLDTVVLNSFSTMFQATIIISPSDMTSSFRRDGAVQGLAFIIAGDDSSQGEGGGYLGWLNSTTNGQASTSQNFAVELDFSQDVQFQDPVDVHVGVDQNNLTSVNTSAIQWLGDDLFQYGQITFSVWIEYDGQTKILDVFLSETKALNGNKSAAVVFNKPTTPVMSTFINLNETLSPAGLTGLFVGFSGSISNNVTTSGSNIVMYSINEWTFNSDGLSPDVPRNADGMPTNLVLEAEQKRRENLIGTVLVATIPSGLVFVTLMFIICLLYRRNARLVVLNEKHGIIDKGVLDQGPKNFKYKELSAATKGFSSSEILGSGGFGSVYRGKLVLKGDDKKTEVAVKRISATSHQGAQEFLAEVKIIGQAQHRNLVRLLGWCHEKGELLLVYDYMPHGSVDQHLFKKFTEDRDVSGEPMILTWSRRLKIVGGVAAAVTYLHEEWEKRVIHRDLKSSNVLLDRDFNARLGDFGLARLSAHDSVPQSTVNLAGTQGYLAPELFHTLKATEKTDVYSFGAVVLEVATGKRPILSVEDRRTTCTDRVLFVDWVWDLYKDDTLLEAADPRLENAFEPGEMIVFLKIGLLCSHPDPNERPSMWEVVNIWKGSSPFPQLPRTKPVPFHAFDSNGHKPDFSEDVEINVSMSMDRLYEQDELSAVHNFDSDGHISAAAIASVHDSDSILAEQERGNPKPTLRYRPRPITSLPF
ncbi:unnamed protein product [Calypogeia fissa]